MVETNQKGRALPIPTKLANTPVWVEWDQDVWDWTNNKWGGKDPYVKLLTFALACLRYVDPNLWQLTRMNTKKTIGIRVTVRDSM